MGERPPLEAFTGPTCRGSFVLGTACGQCEKCLGKLAQANQRVPLTDGKIERERIAVLEGALRGLVRAWESPGSML